MVPAAIVQISVHHWQNTSYSNESHRPWTEKAFPDDCVGACDEPDGGGGRTVPLELEIQAWLMVGTEAAAPVRARRAESVL